MVKEIRHILVPIDGSEAALAGLRFAEAIALPARASLLLVHVVDATMLELLHVRDVREGKFAGMSDDELDTLVRRHVADPYFEAAKFALENDEIELELRAARGHPAEEICKLAREWPADLIVMGARGASGFQELLLGSVTLQVVHHAPCPVTVVR